MTLCIKKPEKNETLTYTIFNTPFGKTGVAVTPFGICRVVLSVSSESDFVEILKMLHPSPKKNCIYALIFVS